MAVEQELYQRLANSTAITSQVGTRSYPSPLPQEATLPAITWTKVSGPREHAMGADPGEARGRFQIDAWAKTKLGALQVRDGLIVGLSRWSSSTGSVTVQDTFLVNEQQLYEDSSELFRVRLDFVIHHTE